jgi:hypothetical protein
MIFSTLCRYSAGLALVALIAVPAVSTAGNPNTCDKIAQDVFDSVGKDPAKVLMIVEDALVINGTCACEIVRSAIKASNADAAMVKQIVQTSIGIAPKMTAVIEECAGVDVSGARTAAATSTDSGKDVVDVSGKQGSGKDGAMNIQPPKDGTADGSTRGAGSNGNFAGSAIRGPYLIQPATGVFGNGGTTTNAKDDEDDNQPSRDRRRERPRVIVIRPVSPTNNDPKNDEPK